MARALRLHPVILFSLLSEAGSAGRAGRPSVVFSVVPELSAARRSYRDLKGRMAKYPIPMVTVLPGVHTNQLVSPDKLSASILAHADQSPSPA